MFSFFALSVFSQGFGVRAGLNLASVSLDQDLPEGIDIGNTMGLQIGVDYEMAFSDALYFNPAVMFSTKGFKYTGEFFGEKFESTSSLKYIEIPLDFVYKMGAEGMQFGVFGGPYLGYFMGGTVSIEDESEDIDSDEVNSIDFGLNFGLGMYLNNISLRASYGLGLSKINSDDTDGEGSIKHKVISLTAGYRF